jgi:hypothetical protein
MCAQAVNAGVAIAPMPTVRARLRKPLMMKVAEVTFPTSVGGSTAHEVAKGRVVKIFMLDSAVPLFNVVLGGMRFLADKEQTLKQIEACRASGGEQMPSPAWEWKFDSGFEHSVDGHRNKGWVLTSL